MSPTHRLGKNRLCHLVRDQSAIAIVEFALSVPILMALSLVGMELSNMAYTRQRLGDIAIQTADNISRVRVGISEGDVTETLSGMKNLGAKIRLAANARIIISSIQPIIDASGVVTGQRIRWQRCTGALVQNSTYGTQGAVLGVTGIGPTDRKIAATANSEVIFVEIKYTYQPLVSNSFFGSRTMTTLASMSVRERSANDLQATGTASSCANYSV